MRLRRAVAWLVIAAALMAAPTAVERLSDARRQALIRQESFAGVLRVWTSEGFSPGAGSLTSWLLSGIRRFERAHPGVYVQLRSVSAGVMAQFMSGAINPPDAILFGQGVLSDPSHLMPLTDLTLRTDLAASGEMGGVLYATPVAMGGSVWMANASMLPEPPTSWAGIVRPKSGKKEAFLLGVPIDGRFSMSAALITLSVQPEAANDAPQPKAGEGVDLGLAAPTAAPTSAPSRALCSMGLPDTLPDGFRKKASVYEDFVAGRIAVMPATQREIYRLARLAESGRAPELAFRAGGVSMTDQIAWMAVVDAPKDDAEARQALCAQLTALLLDDTSQKALSSVGAFPVVEGLTLYAAVPGMAQIESSLARTTWTPSAFEAGFRDRARSLADRFQLGEIDAVKAIEELMR